MAKRGRRAPLASPSASVNEVDALLHGDDDDDDDDDDEEEEEEEGDGALRPTLIKVITKMLGETAGGDFDITKVLATVKGVELPFSLLFDVSSPSFAPPPSKSPMTQRHLGPSNAFTQGPHDDVYHAWSVEDVQWFKDGVADFESLCQSMKTEGKAAPSIMLLLLSFRIPNATGGTPADALTLDLGSKPAHV